MNWKKKDLLNLLDNIQEGVFVIDNNLKITFFNHAAEVISGIKKEKALGRPCWKILRSDSCDSSCPLRKTLDTGELVSERIVNIVSRNGEKKPVSISTTLIKDNSGKTTGAVETFRDLSSDRLLKNAVDKDFMYNIITINDQMLEIIGTLPTIAQSESTVMLHGESGTGKELFARALHSLSPRRNGPFIAVNCGALPDNLLESELFGYKAGAFTDAKKDKPGRFTLAEGGVIFLDEIGDTSTAMQVKLLRVIQEKTYEPLGGLKSINADVRIIAATNRDIIKMVEEGGFRKDLYYRLGVINLHIPPLCERKDDIPLLIDHTISRLNKRDKKQIRGVSDDAMTMLVSHDYPGNVRELENIIEHAFVLCNKGYIHKRHLPSSVREYSDNSTKDIKSLKNIEKAFIQNALNRNGGKRSLTAKELCINRSSLYRKMRKLGINSISKEKLK